MTRQQTSTAVTTALELLAENGFDGLAGAIEALFNEAMKIERDELLNAAPHERRSYANGFKPKSVQSRLGVLSLAAVDFENAGVKLSITRPRSVAPPRSRENTELRPTRIPEAPPRNRACACARLGKILTRRQPRRPVDKFSAGA